ncbi:MAG: aspartate kinase [Psychrilyobacter sp.]|uniref:aspartate kinase n=1 Tax=Psychrilyobacter sp. TaxID=2586924 RepID=UPI003C7903A8
MGVIIQKFGGTSVKNTERILEVAKKIVESKKMGNSIVAVLSAQGGYTDILLEKAHKISKTPKKRELDVLLSTGEQISIALLAMAIEELGESAVSFTATQLGIKTCSNHNCAQILDIDSKKIKQALEEGNVVVVAGFQGVDLHGNITTLGRGGSDTTAVALGVTLGAKEVEIYTDVDGIYSADPRVVKNAKKINRIAYSEMIEMAGNGAKVLHSRSVELACKYNIKIHLRSSYSWTKGSIIKGEDKMEKEVIRGITHSKNLSKITLRDTPHRLADVISTLSNEGYNIDIITHDFDPERGATISCILKQEILEKAFEILREKYPKNRKNLVHIPNLGKVSVIGIGVKSKGVAAQVFKVLSENNISIEMVSSSDINISCIIHQKDLEKAVSLLHERLIEEAK